jgi:putative MFS transporter
MGGQYSGKTEETEVTAESGSSLPQPGPPAVEDSRVGRLAEAFGAQYRKRTIMLSVANFFQTIGF